MTTVTTSCCATLLLSGVTGAISNSVMAQEPVTEPDRRDVTRNVIEDLDP